MLNNNQIHNLKSVLILQNFTRSDIKEIIDQIAPVLVEVFNKSMMLGEFPSLMKLAEVVPLYKGKEHFLETNYQPISLLTTVSKILEKLCTNVYTVSYRTLDKSITINMASEPITVVNMQLGKLLVPL